MNSVKTRQKQLSKGLFCACLEVWTGREWKANTIYLHAEDSGEARAKVATAHPNRNKVRIVAVASVIGYHVDDEHGDKLRV